MSGTSGANTRGGLAGGPAGGLGSVRAAVVGASGYAGRELLLMLSRHPGAVVCGAFASEKSAAGGARVGDVVPSLRGVVDLPLLAADVRTILASEPAAVFLATPHEVSAEMAGPLLEAGVVVLDLSAAFRLPAGMYPRHYGFVHPRPELCGRAVYGLAERARGRVAGADLIAVPGCYPTAAILGLGPLYDAGAVVGEVIVDAISGVSGAGRKASMRTSFCEVSAQPYGVLAHRHEPEIALHTGAAALVGGGAGGGATGEAAGGVRFTPHLGPWDRGILATMHATLREGWDAGRVQAELERVYAREAFVRVLAGSAGGGAAGGGEAWPGVGAVAGTNFCDVAAAGRPGENRVIVFSAIDNLLKGAAGQAVQCFNIRMGFGEGEGLPVGRVLGRG